MSGKLIRMTEEELGTLVRDAYGEGVIDGVQTGYDLWEDSEAKKELKDIIEGQLNEQ